MSDGVLSFETLAVTLGMMAAYGPVIALILARKRLGALSAAMALVLWGAFIPIAEHAGFAISESRELAAVPGVGVHARYHFFMAGAFTLVAGIMIAIVALTLLRQGQRSGWYATLMALLVGGGFELSGAAGTLFHGFPPSWALGLVIYAYPLAWASALVIAYRPVFRQAAVRRQHLARIAPGNERQVYNLITCDRFRQRSPHWTKVSVVS